MKRNRFTDEEIIGILKEHEAGTPVSELCRKHGWRKIGNHFTALNRPLKARGELAFGFNPSIRAASAATVFEAVCEFAQIPLDGFSEVFVRPIATQ